MYWFKERSYKTLESAIAAYEEYKKNERILNGEGLAPLPRISTYTDFGPPDMLDVPIGVLYFDMHANKIWMLNSKKEWVQMANYDEYKTTAAKGNKNIANCRNCGAPARGYRCEYCGTVY